MYPTSLEHHLLVIVQVHAIFVRCIPTSSGLRSSVYQKLPQLFGCVMPQNRGNKGRCRNRYRGMCLTSIAACRLSQSCSLPSGSPGALSPRPWLPNRCPRSSLKLRSGRVAGGVQGTATLTGSVRPFTCLRGGFAHRTGHDLGQELQ